MPWETAGPELLKAFFNDFVEISRYTYPILWVTHRERRGKRSIEILEASSGPKPARGTLKETKINPTFQQTEFPGWWGGSIPDSSRRRMWRVET